MANTGYAPLRSDYISLMMPIFWYFVIFITPLITFRHFWYHHFSDTLIFRRRYFVIFDIFKDYWFSHYCRYHCHYHYQYHWLWLLTLALLITTPFLVTINTPFDDAICRLMLAAYWYCHVVNIAYAIITIDAIITYCHWLPLMPFHHCHVTDDWLDVIMPLICCHVTINYFMLLLIAAIARLYYRHCFSCHYHFYCQYRHCRCHQFRQYWLITDTGLRLTLSFLMPYIV